MKENKRHRTSIDSFKAYDNKHNITYSDYCLILKTFNYLLVNKLYNGEIFSLPHRTGTLGIYKRKTFGRGIFDYQQFASTGDKVWKKNFHSSAYAASFVWSIKHPWTDLEPAKRAMFKFDPSREVKRSLAKQIKQNNTIHKYYDIN